MPRVDLQKQYFELLGRLATLEPPPAVMGGFAEDALLFGRVTRVHADVDLLIPRPELSARLRQFSALGFERFESYFDEGPGRPLVLHAEAKGLHLELGVSNIGTDGRPWFSVPADAPGEEYVIGLPQDTFSYPASQLAGVCVQTISPTALYQMRAALAITGAFGALRPHDVEAQAKLRAAFWPTATEDSLQPEVHRRRRGAGESE